MSLTPLVRAPLVLALGQLDDPAFLTALAETLAWTAAVFAALFIGLVWAAPHVLPESGVWAWVGRLLGGLGAVLAAFWLFVPVAVAMGTLFIERIAGAVERRYYPDLPPGLAAPLTEQIWDGFVVGVRVLLLTALSLLLALLLPGIGVLLGWAISGWAIGRGFFVAVAMRRMPRKAAQALARRNRGPVLLQGGVLALASFIPPLNLLIPVLGVAAMVHLLHSFERNG
jgi:uncharacterized protein involved in cysteine biosynthesis